ncbi:MAG: chemotaxis protein CheW [Thermodesulfobacteriota bacterium]
MTRVRSKYTHPDFRFTCFSLDGVEFGVSIDCVKEVIGPRRITPLSGGPGFIEGVVRLRSMAVPVVDLRKRFNLNKNPASPPRVIVLSFDGRITGLLVDEISEVMTGGKKLRPGKGPRGSEPWRRCLDVVLETGSGTVRVLDLGRLFTPSELAMLDAPLVTKEPLRKAK